MLIFVIYADFQITLQKKLHCFALSSFELRTQKSHYLSIPISNALIQKKYYSSSGKKLHIIRHTLIFEP
jgi:hypothetical protein